MNGPGHDVNSCKLLQPQAKSMRLTWLTSCGGGSGCVRFQGANKHLTKGQGQNTLVASALLEVLKQNKHVKATDTHNYISEDDLENFNF